MDFILGKYLVEVSSILFFLVKVNCMMCQRKPQEFFFYFMLSNLSFKITMSLLIQMLLDYLTLSFKFLFQIQIFKSYCLVEE